MSSPIYTTLARQQGLMQEMQVVANNLANSSTTGYKSDRAIFTEFLVSTGDSPDQSLSMGGLGGHAFQLEQGGLNFTGGRFDLAIQGEGFFMVETPQGERLTRAGHFQLSGAGQLVDMQGNPVLSAGGNPITIPDDATDVSFGEDGTISGNGQIIDQVGIMLADGQLTRDSNTYFAAEGGVAPTQDAKLVQGALEQSNVSPVLEVSRMIEVQRAYEAGQALLEKEDQRISQLITAVRER
ncbi:flagellar basal-body rod protein FlgF [Hyphomonas neptunium ATCC 15444]|uniref:Flagellar basal-body rod protein FlgF n=2 Tax=Hyphomonas TaxID=85 RepID=Q0C5K7_HYPNA|nr:MULTISPECIES: flagellar hook-basal body complex protein [Hyphomonas]ABI78233.1 flagellar basal-body rod protein FlgF [Hyphomonas neptunium ATCC 15444]KCZ95414.1 flagellar basal body rod protein FlgF [Hyphomonas hirschiana VP5]